MYRETLLSVLVDRDDVRELRIWRGLAPGGLTISQTKIQKEDFRLLC
jgi:hypothetical protein